MVTSGIRQGSVLGPILFNLFINALEEGVRSFLVKFVDDTKMGVVATTEEQVLQIQKDLDRLWKWAGDNRMAFSVDKCKVLHLGHRNRCHKYSTKMVFYVWNQSPHQVLKGHDVARTLKSELRKQQSAFLIFRALEINTVTCQLNCSEHGHCNSFTKRCVCDPFWMENFLRVQLGDGESNCEWSVLYVVIALFVIVVSFGIFFWVVVCCCRRRKGKPKRKSKYKILDATDQESLELKPNPKAGNKQKSQAQNTSLMHSESELDSDEAIFTWPDREKGKLLHNQNGFLRNGQATPKLKKQREEIL
ncbi:hypothetical protein EYD10_07942 [Varanus komodoensis]|nr:hypothetical protein EYD10_07942 [Varanus komodoensis]